MCDTVVATGEVTKDGVTIFGKNSDREPNEAHYLSHFPAQDYAPNSRVQCTYIDIPQANHTHAVLLAKPFWLWGAEMGANEHGLVIGNEAVFTKIPHHKKKSLIGMDILRLALERAATVKEAITVITDLIAEYGQAGNCGFRQKLFYHNSFILADPYNTWVLETADQHWAAKQINGVYTISNGLTIKNEWDLASPNLVTYAIKKGWCKTEDDFDFARCYSDFLFTKFSDCRRRCQRTTDLLTSQQGNITVNMVIQTLRDHGKNGDTTWRPDKGLSGANVCMHAGFGPIRISQTTGSMVSYLHPNCQTHFATGTAAPCTGIFKPLWVNIPIPEIVGPVPDGTYNPNTLFWRHEALHRLILNDYATFIQTYKAERDALEQKFVAQAIDYAQRTIDERSEFSAQCFAEADAAEKRWLKQLFNLKIQQHPNLLYKIAWHKFNRQAKMPNRKMNF